MKAPRFLVCAGLASLALAALGAESSEEIPASAKPPTDFKSLDTDGDGRISLDEFTAPAEKYREATRQEVSGVPKEPPSVGGPGGSISAGSSIEDRFSPEVFRQLDVNHDDYLSPAELEALFNSAHAISQP